MNILAFDTSDAVLGVALKTPKGSIAEIRDAGLRHQELLMGSIENLLIEGGVSVDELDLIVCPRGPGSFTGLRIGMAAAKGLSAGSGVPVVSVPVPDFLASPYSFVDFPVIPVLDAKKDRFYGAVFEGSLRKSTYFDLSASEVVDLFPAGQRLLITGPGAHLFSSRLEKAAELTIVQSGPAAVFDMLELGVKLFRLNGADAPGQGPEYIRKSEAEIFLEKHNGGGK